MIDESFSKGNSFIHNLDPRFKLLAGALISIQVALLQQYHSLLFSLVLAIGLLLLSRLNLIAIAKRLLVVNIFIGLLWLVVPFTYPGQPLIVFGFLAVKAEGIHFVTIITLKSNVLLLLFITQFSSINIATIGRSLQYFRLPSKLVGLLLFTYRYIEVMFQEYNRLRKAARVRCFTPKTNFHTYKTYAYFVGMLIVNASNRGEKIHQAMRCRCFEGKYYSLQTFHSKPTDWIYIITLFFNIIIIGALEWAIHSH